MTFDLPQTHISAEPGVFEKKCRSDKKCRSKVNIGRSKVTTFRFFFKISFGTIKSRKNSYVDQRSPPTLVCAFQRTNIPRKRGTRTNRENPEKIGKISENQEGPTKEKKGQQRNDSSRSEKPPLLNPEEVRWSTEDTAWRTLALEGRRTDKQDT